MPKVAILTKRQATITVIALRVQSHRFDTSPAGSVRDTSLQELYSRPRRRGSTSLPGRPGLRLAFG